MTRVATLLPIVGHPRDSKRIAMLQAAGFSVEAAAFERLYHTGRMPSCDWTSLGFLHHGRYAERLLRLLRAVPIVRRIIRRSDLVYASGPDMALLGLLAGIGLNRPVVLEIGDIRRVQVARGIGGAIMRQLDRAIINRCGLLVSTAKGFVEGYYRAQLGSRIPVVYLENKLDQAARRKLDLLPPVAPRPLLAGRRLVIGWFGVLRCEWSWNVLAKIAREHGDRIEVIVAGHPLNPPDLPDRAKGVPNLRYLGEYRSPEDLPNLYGQVDLVWTVYPGPEEIEPAWRWALLVSRSNRFYESCFFRRPIITLHDSGDGEVAESLGVALCLRTQEESEIVDRILQVKDSDLQSWEETLAHLPESVHSYTTEGDELKIALNCLIGR
jgi:succinoglycan biosynthesis protein ExoL